MNAKAVDAKDVNAEAVDAEDVNYVPLIKIIVPNEEIMAASPHRPSPSCTFREDLKKNLECI